MNVWKALHRIPGARSRFSSTRPPPKRCEHCNVHVEPIEVMEGLWGSVACCEDCAGRVLHSRIAREETELEQERIRALAIGLTDADWGTPSSYSSPSLRSVQLHPGDSSGITKWRYWWGGPSTGKTTQLVLGVRKGAEQGYRCRYMTELDILSESRNGKAPQTIADGYEVLAIDELGRKAGTGWSEAVCAVLDGRYRANLPTLLASNHGLFEGELPPLAQLEGYGQRVADRIFERAGSFGVVELTRNWRRPQEVLL